MSLAALFTWRKIGFVLSAAAVLVLAACGTATPAVPTSSTPDLSKVTLTIGSPCKT
jgi:hypothetical protein